MNCMKKNLLPKLVDEGWALQQTITQAKARLSQIRDEIAAQVERGDAPVVLEGNTGRATVSFRPPSFTLSAEVDIPSLSRMLGMKFPDFIETSYRLHPDAMSFTVSLTAEQREALLFSVVQEIDRPLIGFGKRGPRS